MDELMFLTGVTLVSFGVACYFIVVEIANLKKAITAKQDAIMAKLIEIKLR
jgi:hypothetical protein